MRRLILILSVLTLCACGLFEPSSGQAPEHTGPTPYVHKQDFQPIVHQRRAWFEACPKGNSTARVKCAMKKEREWEESTKR